MRPSDGGQDRRARGEADGIWSSALQAATSVVRRSAASEVDVLRAVTDALRRLRLRGGVMLLTPEGELEVRSRSLSHSTEASLRRLAGLDIAGYRFDPQKVDLYREAFSTGQAVFGPERSRVVAQMMPGYLRPLLPRILHLLGDHPVIVAPLILEDQALGAINVVADWLTPRDLPMVTALADHIAVALGHVRARREMQATLERERLRGQVAEAISSELDMSLVLERIIRLAAELCHADAGAIGLIDPDGKTISYPYLFQLPASLRVRPSPLGEGLAWYLVENRKPMILENYADHPMALPGWVEAGVKGFLGVPLFVAEIAVGALGLFNFSKQRPFRQDDLAMAEAIAPMAAIALRNAALYAQARRRAEESQALIRTARSISASLDLETVLALIAEQAKELLKADGSRIHLLDQAGEKLQCLIALDPSAEALMHLELRPGEGLVGHVLESGRPLLSNDPAADPRSLVIPGTPVDEPECLMMAPLSIRARPIGVMTVRRLGTERPFQHSELEMLSALASHAAVAIENAHLYGQIEAQAQRLEEEVIERTRDLALSEARYRSLVETSLAGIFQTDLEGRVTYANQAFAELLTTTPAQILNRGLEAWFPPEHREEFLHALREPGGPDRPPRGVHDVQLQAQDGHRLPALLAISRINDAQGAPQGTTGLVLDISDRKRLEAALRAQRDRLHAILASVGDAVEVTDAEGRIEYVNPAWERLTGYSTAEVLGQNPRLVRSEQTPSSVFQEMWGIIRQGRTWRGELVNRRKDGSTYDAALTITPILDEQGKVINHVGAQYDISALKEIDRLKSQFVLDVSHELRTPLTNIKLYLDLLAETEDRARAALYLETLSRESDRLANLIDDLLSLSRLEAGAVPFYPTPVDINRLLGALVADRTNLASQRGLDLSLDDDRALPHALGDERLLSQVFTNLLTNAMNYTPEAGKIVLRTRTWSAGSERAWVTVEVSDTGFGIPPEEQPMIFRRFFRGRASHHLPTAGTGLGLAICKEIAERHGGRITVESEGVPGKGTRFTVWLPAAEAQ